MGTQKGKLTVVARTAGLKMEIQGVESNWINPTKEAKENALQRIDELKGNVGKNVTLTLTDDGHWSSLQVDDAAGEEPQVEEESIQEEAPQEQAKLAEKPAEAPKKAQEAPKKEEAPKEPEPEEEPEEEEHSPLKAILGGIMQASQGCTDPAYFKKLQKIEGATKTIPGRGGNLTYMSWAEAWEKLKEQYPDAHYHVHENKQGMPYFCDSTGGFVKVSLTVCGMTHTVHLPIMDSRNQSIKKENMSTFDINKNIQRALTKAIAMHGMGLYVYKGEDFPDKDEGEQ